MRWQGRRSSSNMQSGGRGVRRGAALSGVGLILGLLVFLITKNPFAAINIALNGGALQPGTVETQELQLNADEQELYDYSGVVLADYLAGVVARHQGDAGYLEKGDIEEAISAAWVIGDDAIQKQKRGYVQPESFTHGSSEQRTRWFQKGYDAGDLSDFDTFDTEKYPDASDL